MRPDQLKGCSSKGMKEDDDDDEVFPLPGFRFHPTDEELVGFYLRRKVEMRPVKMELIKHVDLYKYDPWDLPKPSNKDHESYFFCKRGRKYRNSVRPNRVITGSGFWKATGIDKPIYTDKRDDRHGNDTVIGLKKTLVYYRGSAGKGTKTDWMMHEFRLPNNDNNNNTNTKSDDQQEAEVWTLCRVFKRTASSRKYTPDWREVASTKHAQSHPLDTSFKPRSFESNHNNSHITNYINFSCPNTNTPSPEEKYTINNPISEKKLLTFDQLSSVADEAAPPMVPSNDHHPSFSSMTEATELFTSGNWDELRWVVDFAFDRSSL